MKGSACIDYNFDGKTRTIISWKISWLNQPAPNVFLDGIFDKTGFSNTPNFDFHPYLI